MKKLLKLYDLKTREQYFEHIIAAYTAGQKMQSKGEFVAMPKAEKKMFLKYLLAHSKEQSFICIFIDLL